MSYNLCQIYSGNEDVTACVATYFKVRIMWVITDDVNQKWLLTCLTKIWFHGFTEDI